MKITLAETAGFCFGVKRAVDTVYKLIDEGKKVCTLGPIIHNPQLVADLESKGVRVVEDVREVKDGEILVIRSHGVPESVMNEAEGLSVQTVDATCPFVAKIHKIVKEAATKGQPVLIAGDEKHKEVIGIIGHCDGEVHVFEDELSLENLFKENPNLLKEEVCVVSQTTFNEKIWENCEKILKKYCTNPSIFGTICNATSMRQTESAELSLKNDAMVIIGGRHSSNTKKLYDVCKNNCGKTLHIETADELSADFFSGVDSVGVVAGASTPAAIIKEVIKTMTEILNPVEEQAEVTEVVQKSFEEMTDEEAFEASLDSLNSDKKVKGVVVQVTPSEILVDYSRGLTGYVSADEYSYDRNIDLTKEVKVGDELNLIIMRTDDMEGTAMLSKRRYDAIAGWDKIIEAKENNEILTGTVSEVVKGGVVAVTNGIRVFIPASQATLSRNDSLEDLKDKEVNFRIIEINRRRRAIGSIRSVLREQRKEEMSKFWDEIAVGDKFTGTVKSLTGYGAFVDLGGVDGMVHISELSWQRIKNPSEVVLVGDTIEVFVKAVDKDKRKISLGYKKDDENPWTIFNNTYKVEDVVKVTIVSMTTYGAFARIIPGIDGLIHISQIANKHIAKPQDELTVGQEVEAKIIAIDDEKKRVSLSIRALLEPEVKEEAEATAENEVVATASEEEVVVADSVAEETAE
ncbi:MAG: bifunctional 4-hydroxy-3-methylbut-2-enyl diphosphate reductase/30S ribosomal protein S1 [Ruminococcaceae bacterium]|nr:bifunctional 4-hydroxy-3-methylbut-2-enyl diphosphate reductase/30S ribosomal protein S1 [Oscillospiraceae bacterium]